MATPAETELLNSLRQYNHAAYDFCNWLTAKLRLDDVTEIDLNSAVTNKALAGVIELLNQAFVKALRDKDQAFASEIRKVLLELQRDRPGFGLLDFKQRLARGAGFTSEQRDVLQITMGMGQAEFEYSDIPPRWQPIVDNSVMLLENTQ